MKKLTDDNIATAGAKYALANGLPAYETTTTWIAAINWYINNTKNIEENECKS